MNKAFIVLGLYIFLSVPCWAGGKRDNNTQSVQVEIPSPNSTANSTIFPYWHGEGGKGIRLGIRVPESQGLSANQAYIPTIVQGVLVSNISKYSAIDVVDRISLDRMIAETLDPVFEDNFDIVRLGHVEQPNYWMTGNIIRTSAGYTIQLNVTDTDHSANTIASYTGIYTIAQFDDHSAIHQASLALLEQMGIELTKKAKDELVQASTPQYVNAQTALAQGITAQRSGTVVEALTYYYQATSFDASLLEAAGRALTLSTYITSGNIGQNVRNDIQQRNAWLTVLREAAVFFREHQPFEIIYDPNLIQGKTNYETETVDISFEVGLFDSSGFKVLLELKQGLENTKKSKDWGLDEWPFTGEARVFSGNEYFNFNVILNNEDGKIIGRTNGNLKPFFGEKKSLSNFPQHPIIITFKNVNANKITDKLSISIINVNNRDIRTIAEQGFIGISTEDFSLLKYPFDIEWKAGTIVINNRRW